MNEHFWTEVVCAGLRVFYVDSWGRVEIAQVLAYDEPGRLVNLAVFTDADPPVVRAQGVPYAPPGRDGSLVPHTFHL